MTAELRHRKQQKQKQPAVDTTVEDEVAASADDLLEDDDDSYHHHDDDDEHESSSSSASSSAVSIQPLVERSLLTRLDVAPFGLVYAVLLWLDYYCDSDYNDSSLNSMNNSNNLNKTTFFLWAVTLLLHLTLVLATQWSVRVLAWVAYYRPSSSSLSSSSSLDDKDMSSLSSSWTHALVHKANDEHWGIAPLTLEQQDAHDSSADDNTNNNNTTTPVLVCRFEDCVYRCTQHPPDVDVTLWTTRTNATSATATTAATTTAATTPQNYKFRSLSYPVHLPLSFYASWTGHEDLGSLTTASRLYGPNTTVLQLPTLMHLLREQVVAPFFLFQVFCVVLWSLDEYWYYALFTLLALALFETTVAYNRLQSLQRLHQAGQEGTQRIWVRRTTATTTTRGAGAGTQRSDIRKQLQQCWMRVTTRELVPGDIVSLTSATPFAYRQQQQQQHQQLPADILLLNGTAVCDEALLTGESIPQLKHALDTTSTTTTRSDDTTNETRLDLHDNEHKESVLFGGTVLLVTTPDSSSDDQTTTSNKTAPYPPPPDGGVLGMVLRTGFETAQGSLLRTMAHSSQSGGAAAAAHNTWDTFVFILLLVCCAIGAASWVLQEGWHDERRNRFRLILHVIIIVTSVVPPELPMELSLAVTNSVADLMKRCQVYCTEHFRIPWAGEVNVCCFDKTGTLTSDEMRLKGIRIVTMSDYKDNDGDDDDELESLSFPKEEDDALILPEAHDTLPWPTLRIMAACHSLAIASSMGQQRGRRSTGSRDNVTVIGDPLEQAVLNHTGYRLMGNNVVAAENETAGVSGSKSISILHRFAFSSKLKRMTVLVTETGGQGVVWALTKGAPETIKELLSKESIPSSYDEIAFHHMSRGRRVLAMAYREVGNVRNLQNLKEKGRDCIECNLIFAGFLVLDCPLKPDSRSVITELRKSGHKVVMITGDAILTAAEVARQVGIIPKSSKNKIVVYGIQKNESTGAAKGGDILTDFQATPLIAKGDGVKSMELSQSVLGSLSGMHKGNEARFCITGEVLAKIATAAVHNEKRGYSLGRKSKLDEKHVLLSPAAQKVLAELVPFITVFARHAPHQKEAVIAAFNRGGYHTLMCGDGTNDVGALKRADVGISIISAPDVESKQRTASETISRAKLEQKRARKGKKKDGDSSSRRQSALEKSLKELREAQEELDYVELGDASVAAPFTSRAVSIKCCKDVIQQGRCTLVTMLSIYKILGINCLVNAMVLSKLFLHGVKQGDRQLTVLGIAVAALFYFVTRAEPLPVLSVVRPPSSVLCLQALLSIATQFSIHMAAILFATEVALSFVDPFDPSLVPDGAFNPNVLNSSTFLLTCLATINTFAVNYRGRPFMADIRENKLLYRSLQACYAVLVICALQVFPPLNDLLQLTELPSAEELAPSSSGTLSSLIRTVDFPLFLCGLMAIDTVLVFAAERLIRSQFDGK